MDGDNGHSPQTGKTWRVAVISYNVNRKLPPIDENELDKFMCSLFAPVAWDLAEDRPNADIIAIGLQEVPWNVFVCTWHAAFRTFLSSYQYTQVGRSYTAGGAVSLLVFLPRNMLACVKRIESKTLWLGAWGYSSHKGAVGLQMRLQDSTNFTFVNAHKSPGDKNLASRLKEYSRIINELRFSDCPSQGIIADDYVYLFGDLNYRVDSVHATNQDMIDILNLSDPVATAKLRSRDQLATVRTLKEAFEEFHEADIHFKPTYRFLLGTNKYDPLRVPSWTDRIVWKVDEIAGIPKDRPFGGLKCVCNCYTSDESVNISDHKPVVASFTVKLCLNAVRFDWRVGFLVPPDSMWICGQPNRCVYVVNGGFTGIQDWIAVYPPGIFLQEKFNSDFDDVITWHCTMASWEEMVTDPLSQTQIIAQNLTFQPFKLPQARGKFRLGFYSKTYNCLIGLSEPFEILDPSLDESVDAADYAFDDDSSLSRLSKQMQTTNIDDCDTET